MNAGLYVPTFPQRTLLTEYSLHPENEALDLLFVFRLEGPLDRPRLRRALEAVLSGALGVNTRFDNLAGPWVALVDPRPFTVREVDLKVSGAPADRAAVAHAEGDLACGRIRPQDPEQVRATLLRTTQADVSYLYVRASHLVGDAYSFYGVMAGISAAYQLPEEQWPELSRFGTLHPGSVTPPDISPTARETYAEMLRGLDSFGHAALNAPKADGRILGQHFGHVLSGDQAQAVRSSWAVARHRTASTFFAAYAALLHRLNPQRDIVIGVPLANRAGVSAKRAIGYFVNTLPLPVRIDADTTWGQLCEQVGTGVRTLQANQGLDLAGTPGQGLRPPAGPATDNAVTFYKQALLLDLPGIRSTSLPITRRALTHPLTLNVADDGSAYTLDLSAADHLIPSAPMDLLLESVHDLVADADRKVISGSVLQVPVNVPTTTRARPSAGASIIQALSRSGTANAQRIALRHADSELTYTQLWTRVVDAAAALDASQATEHVVVRMDKGIDAVVAMLAVICSGRVYVPVDPAAPVERAVMIEERITSTQGHPPTVLAAVQTGPAPEDYELPVLSAERIAYVIFTSGSTGEPKGVQIPHGNVLDLMHSTATRCGLGRSDVWCLFHSLAFDFSIWEVFGPLLTGGTLVVPDPDQIRDPLAFAEFLQREQITVLNQTPSAFRRLCAAAPYAQADLSAVRLVVFGGEALYPVDVQPLRTEFGPTASAVNMYGITETTVHVTARDMTDLTELSGQDQPGQNRSVIGEALDHLGLLIVDQYGRLTPSGLPGELLVTGTGLARGYLGRPDLTENRFVLVHHDGITERAYRTGDLVRREGAELVYVGRGDDQVQLRGHRIELGEVQAALLGLSTISACVVRLVERDGTEPFLAAWVVGGQESEVSVLRAALQHRIPAYMVPTRFTWVPEIPMNQNGKPDLAALERLAAGPPASEKPGHRAAPAPAQVLRGPRQQEEDDLAHRIARIWSQVIGSGPVGVHDQYLEVGGTSMHLTAIHQQISAEPGVASFSLVDLYEYPTPQALADRLSQPADRPSELVLDHYRQV